MNRRTYLYAALAIVPLAFAGAFSEYWVLQAILLTLLASALVVDTLRRAEVQPRPEDDQPILRSRVAHYVRIARVRDSARLIETASNPFELALLRRKGWSGLTAGQLRELGVDLPGSETTAPGPTPEQR